MQVQIKRIDKELPLPQYQTAGSVAVDLYSRENISVGPHQIALIKSNLIVKTPPGYFFMIASRSSTPMKKGLMLANGIGVVDQDFCGEKDEIKLQFVNFSNKPVEVARGERIAQGIFVKIDRVEWNEVDEMLKTSRGGFGSTSIS